MDFWKCTENAVIKAVNDLVEKNRRTAMINRLKIVVKNERDAQNHAFVQLGKYYYQNLRDKQNGDTEIYCAAADKAGARLTRAYAKLDELCVSAQPASPTADSGEKPEDKPADSEEPSTDGQEPDEPPIPDEPDPDNEEAADDDENPLDPFSVKDSSGDNDAEKPQK